jgi:hypothetical protein
VVVVMVLVSASTTMVVGERRSGPCGQERGSGHDGQNQRLTKHQQSPHLVEHLRRVHSEKIHTPWLLTLPNRVESHWATKRSLRSPPREIVFGIQRAALIGWKTAQSVSSFPFKAFKITIEPMMSNQKGEKSDFCEF